jgi:DNA invertase Pin-like site-specific DNA recombinase
MDGYLRQSRAQREGGSSLEQQRQKIEAWANLRGARIVEWHADQDVSGKTLERPGLQAALDRVRSGEVEGIVVSDLSRLSRANVGDALKLFATVRDEYGGTVVIVDLGGESVDPSTATGEAIITVLLAMARLEWRMTSEKVAAGKAESAHEGIWLGSPPLGYVTGPDFKLKPGPEAPLVREIFERTARNGAHEALRWLNAGNGGVDRKNGRPRQWTRTWLKRVVGRRCYLGHTDWNGIVKEGVHPALVDLATWTRANRQVKGLEPYERAPAGAYPFSGLACCSECGAGLKGTLAGGRRTGDGARRGSRAYRGRCEHGVYVRADALEGRVRELLLESALMADEHASPDAHLVRGPSAAVDAAGSAIESARLRRQEDAQNLDLPADVLTARDRAHAERIERLEAEYAEAVEAAAPAPPRTSTQDVVEADLPGLARIIERMGDRVRVKPGRAPIEERVAIVGAS